MFKIMPYIILLQFSVVTSVSAQLVEEEFSLNNGVIMAMPFCSDVAVDYSNYNVSGECLWFEFKLMETTVISFYTQGSPAIIKSITSIESDMCYTGTGDLHINNQQFDPGTYFIIFDWPTDPSVISINDVRGIPCLDACDQCLPPFSLLPNKLYIINAWSQEENTPLGTTTYAGPQVVVEAPVGAPIGTFTPSGPIIDGWQRIEGAFLMPALASSFKLSLEAMTGPVLFDDVRIFPADGSMKCYVYDPVTLRFVAELDERHFATFYEYDNEGNLVRVKKETERGIKTLKETRQNAPHFEVQ